MYMYMYIYFPLKENNYNLRNNTVLQGFRVIKTVIYDSETICSLGRKI